MQKVIQIARESVLTNAQREGVLVENPLAQKELMKQIDALFTTFLNVLQRLASQDDNECDDNTPLVSQLIGTPNMKYISHNSSNMLTWEQRLLTTLSNCQYTKKVIFNDIIELFRKCGFHIPNMLVDNIKNKLETFEKSLLEDYLEQKSDPLVGTIEPSMYLGYFDWDTNETPTDIRPYAKECINNLIHVLSEVSSLNLLFFFIYSSFVQVNSISPVLIDNVIPQVVQTIAEELYRLMSCVQKFSLAGSQQACADISVLQEFLSNYSTPKAR